MIRKRNLDPQQFLDSCIHPLPEMADVDYPKILAVTDRCAQRRQLTLGKGVGVELQLHTRTSGCPLYACGCGLYVNSFSKYVPNAGHPLIQILSKSYP